MDHKDQDQTTHNAPTSCGFSLSDVTSVSPINPRTGVIAVLPSYKQNDTSIYHKKNIKLD